jgi:TetR/AcrR family transcriptional repressor of nem operon
VLQGAFILAKASDDSSVALESVDHLDRYIRLLFAATPSRSKASPQLAKETP